LENAAHSLGLELIIRDIRTADDLLSAFEAAAREKADSLVTTTESLFVVQRQRVVELAARYKLPGMSPLKLMVEAGGLMAYGSYTSDFIARAAIHVDKVLRGAKPVDLPVEQPIKFELVVNLKAAEALGISIPQSVLARADNVIE
jgi:putative ABC transport system substrate-binding protein